MAVGVNADGRREVLGMDIGPSEAETFWTAFLRKLARRGLRGVNRYDDAGADVWLGSTRSWRMVRPSGTEAPGARSAGRPMYMMSCELALVAGRLCDSPGCAVSADP